MRFVTLNGQRLTLIQRLGFFEVVRFLDSLENITVFNESESVVVLITYVRSLSDGVVYAVGLSLEIPVGMPPQPKIPARMLCIDDQDEGKLFRLIEKEGVDESIVQYTGNTEENSPDRVNQNETIIKDKDFFDSLKNKQKQQVRLIERIVGYIERDKTDEWYNAKIETTFKKYIHECCNNESSGLITDVFSSFNKPWQNAIKSGVVPLYMQNNRKPPNLHTV